MRKLLLAAIVLLFGSTLFADTLYLDNGKTVEGSITVLGPDAVIIRTNDGIEEISRQHVKRIVSDSVRQPSPATAIPVPPSPEHLLKKEAFEPMKYNDWASRQEKEAGSGEFTAVKVKPAGRRIESVLKLSADLPGDHAGKLTLTSSVLSHSARSTVKTTAGFSLAGETVGYLNDFLGAGLGIAYQIPRKMKDYDGNFNFMPLYAVLKVRTRPAFPRRYYYLVSHCGYDFFFADRDYKGDTATLSGGLHYAVGAGAMLNKLNIEVMYTVSNGTFKDSGYIDYYGTWYEAKETIDVQYSKIAVTAGINFQ